MITGHVSGYIRVFSSGFSNLDSLPLSHRMIINLIFRVKASDLPIVHLAASPSSSYITALDSADNLYLLGGPQYEFALYGFMQLKTQPHLTRNLSPSQNKPLVETNRYKRVSLLDIPTHR